MNRIMGYKYGEIIMLDYNVVVIEAGNVGGRDT